MKKKIVLLEEQLKKAIADYQNLEKRISKEIEYLKKEKIIRLADKLLAVLDNLERAEKYLKNQGLKMAVAQFKEVIKSEGIEEIKTEKEEFNPETMDCLAVVPGPKNTVVETVNKGYILNGTVIRPAKVKVGNGLKKGEKK